MVEAHRSNDQCNIVDQKVFNAAKWGHRHTQCLILFFTLSVAYSMRSCVGVALVAMVDSRSCHKIQNSTFNFTDKSNSTEDACTDEFKPSGFLNALLLTPPYPKFNWSKKVQDTVMSGFFWGYLPLQLPAGQLAYKFGARFLLFGALIINCVLSLIFPAACYYGGWIFAFICRLGQGLSQACFYPSFHSILSKWSPLEERGRMSAIVFRGQSIGISVGLPITGFIASSLGWPGIFWFYGMLSGITGVAVWFILADSPSLCKRLSASERRYIEKALEQKTDEKALPVPWKSILTDPGMIAIIAAHIGTSTCHLILYTEVPAYMDQVMGVDIKHNGLLTALPFMTMFCTHFFFSWVSDMLIVKKYFNVKNTRKLVNSMGVVPAAIGLVVLAYAPHNIYIVESILIFICGIKVSESIGFFINHIDISPNFACVMMSISNFSSYCVASFAPIIIGLILTDVTDRYLWRKVFIGTGGLYFITNLIYVVLAKGEVAKWNDPRQNETSPVNELLIDKENMQTNYCNKDAPLHTIKVNKSIESINN